MRYIALLFVVFSIQLSAQTKTIKQPTYTLTCPANWDTARYNGLLAFLTPLEAGDMFRENLNIVTQPKAEWGNTLNDYLALNIKQIEGMGVTDIQQYGYTVGKQKGYLIVYTTDKFSKGVFNQKLWQLFAEYNGKYFVVTYSSVPEAFEQYLPAMEQVAATIVFN